MHLDLLSIPQSGGKNVKTFRWDQWLKMLFVYEIVRYISAYYGPVIVIRCAWRINNIRYMCLCVCILVYNRSHITAQSGPVILL